MENKFNDIFKIREQTPFLGYEFLTWLLLMLDNDPKGEVLGIVRKLMPKDDALMILGQRIITCLFSHKEQKTSITSPVLESSHEVFASLKNGHVVEALSLVISVDERTVSFMIHATDFAITQVKIKNNFKEDLLDYSDDGLDEADVTEEEIFLRMNTLFEIESIIDALYARFLEEKLDGARFNERLKVMRLAIEQRLDSYLTKASKPEPERASSPPF